MSTSPVSYALEGSTAILTMDDGKANALSDGMITDLVAALDRAEKEASAVVLAGRAERFSAGFDLRAMMSGADIARALLTRGSGLLMRFYGSPLPVVVACTGHALAGGALLVLTGDVRIGANGAFKIGLNEVQIGMPVPILAMELARDRLPKTELHRATLLANIYAPADAVRAGYLDVVVEPGEVMALARAEATRLGAFSRTAYAATKERLRGATIAHIESTLESDMARLLTPVA